MKLNRRFLGAVAFWCLTLLWMVFIFLMSAKTADSSSEMSGSVIHSFASLFVPDYGDMSDKQMYDFIEGLQDMVRTLGHLLEYTMLGALLFGSFKLTLNNLRWQFVSAFGVGTAYALSDEIHQLFVPGRAFQLSDILVDGLGVLLGIAIMLLLHWILKIIKRKNKKDGSSQ